MPLKTDLNVTPYFDDYSAANNFQQILARPGQAIQARELTQLQSILRNQSEKLGDFLLQEGTVVIPGNLKLSQNIDTIKLAPTYGGETTDVTQYQDAILTGTTTGVQSAVVHVEAATTDDPPTLFLRNVAVGTDNETKVFAAGETLSANKGITNGSTSYSTGDVSAQVAATLPNFSGILATMSPGVYYLRGGFVEVEEETLTLSKYSNGNVNARVGFTITEEIVTPEEDSSLLDNATGTSNYAAKGAHRVKISVTLAKLDADSDADSNFIQLMELKGGRSTAEPNRAQLGTIQETLARRTFDESGDYTVRPFMYEAKESVTLNDNIGVYEKGDVTEQGNTASTALLSIKVSPGKAYIRGNEVEKMTNTFIDVDKARTFANVNTASTAFDIGNFLNITNVYGTPDVTFITGETTPFKQISLFDTPTATRGSSSGTRIGVGRTRTMEYSSGTVGPEANYKLYIFDFRPFTIVTLDGTPSPTLEANHSNGGVQIKGDSSGATGWVFADGTSGTTLILTNVSGTFQADEKITASDSEETDKIVETSGNTDITITRSVTKTVSEARQVHMADDDGGQNFTADIVLSPTTTTESFLLLNGTDSAGADVDDHIVAELDTVPIGLNRATTGGTGSTLNLAKLQFAEKNASLFKLNKNTVKTHLTTKNSGASDTSYYLRRQFITTSSASGVITLSAGTNEVFNAHAEVDYTLSILSAGGGGTGQQGDVVSASTGFSGGGTATVTITNNAVFGNGAKVKIIATLLKSSAIAKTKTTKLMKQVKVVAGTTDAYGTRPTDKTISLGRGDVFKLVAVLDSEDTSADATAPVLTIGSISGNFVKGEEITGSSSGAAGRIIDTSSPMSYVLKRGTTAQFTTADTITGFSTGATAPVTAVTTGSTNITARYELDTGQRDNYYDIARIVRKPGVSSPLGRLLIIHDYLEHGTGDFFTVDSYIDVADQMTYEDIPIYTATKVDPDDPAPSGSFPLQDCFDIRPRAENIAGTAVSIETVDEITGNSFDFFNRQFDGTGASLVDFLKPSSLITSDFEYYLPYRALLIMERSGKINFIKGVSTESPRLPEMVDGAMKLAEVTIPAYTFRPQDVIMKREKNRRYTMRDIGKLDERMQHVEYYTALSLLERDAEGFEIQDANGLNRFKSGFVVDDFSGHRVGDAKHKDYKNSIDMENNELRPTAVPKGIGLIEAATTDAERASAGYQKTGALLTLPYTEVVFTEQPYATRVERVTPVLVSNWVGTIELDPAGDEWFETEVAPDLIINVEGNYDTFFEANKSAIGTVWNAWQTTWSGTSVSTSGSTAPGGVQRTITTTRSNLARTGVQTSIVPQIDLESQGTKVIQRAFIPFCRARNITFTGTQFYPNMRLYPFFDKQSIIKYVTPLSGYTTDAADVSGVPAAESPLITTASGEIKGVFALPDPRVAGNPKFKTGEVEFRLTSSVKDVRTKDPETEGTTTYQAVGILETEQETIIATRNAKLFSTPTSQSTSVSSSSVRSVQTRFNEPDSVSDPLAQTFIVEQDVDNEVDAAGTNRAEFGAKSSGRFVTSIELYFSAKAETLPVTVEIRTVQNGFPAAKIMPFGRTVKEPADVTLTSDASTPTKFTFDSPVFLQHETEYCFVVIASTPEYKVWLSRMGETVIGAGAGRTVSKQPHIGVLFKGHNNRTWAPSLTEDLKFKMNVAKFDTTAAGKVTLNNDAVDSRRLDEHPLIFTNGSTTLLVNHSNHQMYSTSNNVTISGVVSEAETTLAAALDATATTLTLTSGTDFDDTSGKYAYDSSSLWWIKIDDEIMKYTTISGTAVSSITRGEDSTSATTHADGATVKLYMLHKVPFTEINKTHTSLSNINIDSYTVALTSSPTITGGSTDASNGGSEVYASENASFDVGLPAVSVMELPATSVTAKIRPMTSTSPSGSQTSFLTTAEVDAIEINLNDNEEYDTPYMIASPINETNENGGVKSLIIDNVLVSSNSDVTPIIDLGRMSFIAVGNKLNKIDSSSDVYPTTDFIASTEPDGDNNANIYLTKKVTLENAATALKVFFAGHRHSTATIKAYYKILRTDDASEFDDLGYVAFNSDGSPDSATQNATTKDTFAQFVYTAGVTDDGVGTPLDEFISFQIKIVLQGTNTAEPPRIKELRCLALAM